MIKLYLSDGNKIWIWFPFNRDTLALVKNLSDREYDSDRRRWLAPFSALADILEAFPHATIEPELQAMIDADQGESVRRFVDSLAMFKVSLIDRGGEIVAEGEGVSPVLQEEVDKRVDGIRALGLFQYSPSY